MLELEFYNYRMRRLDPTNLTISEVIPQSQDFIVDETPRVIRVGMIGSVGFAGNWYIEENKLKIVGISASTATITSVDTWKPSSLTTGEQTYTKFKFVQ